MMNFWRELIGENAAPDWIARNNIRVGMKKREEMLRFTNICERMYKTYSTTCIWYLKGNNQTSALSLRFPKKPPPKKEKTTHCLLDPKNRLIQHWLTFCSDPSILAFTSLFSLGVNWEEENNSFNGTWDHVKDLYKGYTITMIEGNEFHLEESKQKDQATNFVI